MVEFNWVKLIMFKDFIKLKQHFLGQMFCLETILTHFFSRLRIVNFLKQFLFPNQDYQNVLIGC